jgi:PTS system mannose-specific IIB component/fructoselysine and glucoselysine-specific PTS system IIB component
MPVVLSRIDDRLVHGQVVIGWGRPLAIDLIVLVDGAVAASDWEQDIYRMAVPDSMEILFVDADEAARHLPAWEASQARVMLLAGAIEELAQVQQAAPDLIRSINLGGLHHRPGRTERLPYVYLDDAERDALRVLSDAGVSISAQNLPGSTAVPVDDLL